MCINIIKIKFIRIFYIVVIKEIISNKLTLLIYFIKYIPFYDYILELIKFFQNK